MLLVLTLKIRPLGLLVTSNHLSFIIIVIMSLVTEKKLTKKKAAMKPFPFIFFFKQDYQKVLEEMAVMKHQLSENLKAQKKAKSIQEKLSQEIIQIRMVR